MTRSHNDRLTCLPLPTLSNSQAIEGPTRHNSIRVRMEGGMTTCIPNKARRPTAQIGHLGSSKTE